MRGCGTPYAMQGKNILQLDKTYYGEEPQRGKAKDREQGKVKAVKAEKGAEDPGVLRKNKYGVKKRDKRINMLAVSRLPVSRLVLLYPVPHQYSLSCLY